MYVHFSIEFNEHAGYACIVRVTYLCFSMLVEEQSFSRALFPLLVNSVGKWLLIYCVLCSGSPRETSCCTFVYTGYKYGAVFKMV